MIKVDIFNYFPTKGGPSSLDWFYGGTSSRINFTLVDSDLILPGGHNEVHPSKYPRIFGTMGIMTLETGLVDREGYTQNRHLVIASAFAGKAVFTLASLPRKKGGYDGDPVLIGAYTDLSQGYSSVDASKTNVDASEVFEYLGIDVTAANEAGMNLAPQPKVLVKHLGAI